MNAETGCRCGKHAVCRSLSRRSTRLRERALAPRNSPRLEGRPRAVRNVGREPRYQSPIPLARRSKSSIATVDQLTQLIGRIGKEKALGAGSPRAFETHAKRIIGRCRLTMRNSRA